MPVDTVLINDGARSVTSDPRCVALPSVIIGIYFEMSVSSMFP